MKYAVADTGSNTIRIGVYEYDNKTFTQLHNEAIFANLAGHIKDGVLTDTGIEVAADAIVKQAEIAKGYGCPLHVFATAAIRNAQNCGEICRKLYEKTNHPIDVLTGEEEAAFSFAGAISDFPQDKGVMIDVGGGSGEVIYYQNGEIQALTSVPWGSLKAFRTFVKGDYPTLEECAQIQSTVLSYVTDHPTLQNVQCENLCIVGGGVRASVKLAKLLANSKALTPSVIENILYQIIEDKNNARSTVLTTVPKRASTIGPGLAIYAAFCRFFDAKNIYISDKGIKEGYILKRLL